MLKLTNNENVFAIFYLRYTIFQSLIYRVLNFRLTATIVNVVMTTVVNYDNLSIYTPFMNLSIRDQHWGQ